MKQERLALLYSDGSFNVLGSGADLAKARHELEYTCDDGHPAIVRVAVDVLEVVERTGREMLQ